MLSEELSLPLPEWHSRGYLPHWEAGEIAQSITFRLAESLPSALLERWSADLETIPVAERDHERRKRIETALDSGRGSGALSNPMIGELVELALLCFDAERYRLHAWSIMPNHVHVLVTPLHGRTLSNIVHSWKSFTAKKATRCFVAKARFGRRNISIAPFVMTRTTQTPSTISR